MNNELAYHPTDIENLELVFLTGEVINLRAHHSHSFFDLQDKKSKISCVVAQDILNDADIGISNGMLIEAIGNLSIYPSRGDFQLDIHELTIIGMGEQHLEQETLFDKLQKEGLFNLQYKPLLPKLIKRVGLVTSKYGDAIHDVQRVFLRNQFIQVIPYYASMQGDSAAQKIIDAIYQAHQENKIDVLMICRGGGAEDSLACFNNEALARIVFASEIPIISGIGHEKNTTLVDLVAAVHVATPTAAAELVLRNNSQKAVKKSNIIINIMWICLIVLATLMLWLLLKDK